MNTLTRKFALIVLKMDEWTHTLLQSEFDSLIDFSQTTVSPSYGSPRTVLRFTGEESVLGVAVGVEPNLFSLVLRYLRVQRVTMRMVIPTMAPTVIRMIVTSEISEVCSSVVPGSTFTVTWRSRFSTWFGAIGTTSCVSVTSSGLAAAYSSVVSVVSVVS